MVGEVVLVFVPLALLLGFIIYGISKIKMHNGACKCKSCKTELSFNDVTISVSDLHWKVETGSERRYVRYYCYLYFSMVCPKCGKSKDFMKEYTLHRSDSTYSRTLGDIYDSVVNKVKRTLPKVLFENQEPDIIGIKNLMAQLEKELC